MANKARGIQGSSLSRLKCFGGFSKSTGPRMVSKAATEGLSIRTPGSFRILNVIFPLDM